MSFGKMPNQTITSPSTQVNAADVSNAYASALSGSAAAAGANSTTKTSGQGVGAPAQTANKMILGL